MSSEPLRLTVAVDLGEDASTEERDEAARLLRSELLDAGLGDVELARGGPVPPGAKPAETFLFGTLTVSVLPAALATLMSVARDWTGRRRGRTTLKLAYSLGEQRLELEYDPDRTDVNQLLAQLVQAQAAAGARTLAVGAGVAVGGDVIGGDKVSHVQAGGDAVGRDKITQIHVGPGATVIVGDAALSQAKPGTSPGEPSPAA
jgi:hypothetical protein